MVKIYVYGSKIVFFEYNDESCKNISKSSTYKYICTYFRTKVTHTHTKSNHHTYNRWFFSVGQVHRVRIPPDLLITFGLQSTQLGQNCIQVSLLRVFKICHRKPIRVDTGCGYFTVGRLRAVPFQLFSTSQVVQALKIKYNTH